MTTSKPMRLPVLRSMLAAMLLTLLVACAATPPRSDTQAAPPVAGGETSGFVASANPLATQAGLDVLRRGGNAIDAVIAVQAMLGLVEPQSSGPAGGAFLLHYSADGQQIDSYIGREQAPASASPAMFNDAEGQPLRRAEAMLSGHATGIPGVMPALELAHEDHGRLPWDTLFEPIAEVAQAGFEITPRLQEHIDGTFPQASASDIKRLFSHPDGTPFRAGETLRNPAYAASLRSIATNGAAALQRGPLAEAIVERLGQPPRGAQVTLADLASYRVERTEPLCRPVRAYIVCVPPPPSSGVGLLELMMILDDTDIAERGADDPQSWLLFAEASRLMYADRDQYVGDPRFVDVPVQGLLDPAYIDRRRALIGGHAAAQAPEHGTPEGAPELAPDATDEPGGTSHFVVVDSDGNAVSMTTTIESFFGSGRVVGGMVMNNQLTDFSWSPGGAAANAIAPGKRPRSSMSPVIVLDKDGSFVGAIGSPGGNAIPAYIAKTLVGWLFWDLPMDRAIGLPNLVARGKNFNGEADAFDPQLLQALSALGVDVESGSGENSGLHGVVVRDGVLHGAADPRREGTAASL